MRDIELNNFWEKTDTRNDIIPLQLCTYFRMVLYIFKTAHLKYTNKKYSLYKKRAL